MSTTFKGLLIGNSTFPEDPHNLPDLSGPVNDLPLLFDALTDSQFGVFEPGGLRMLPERTKRDITTTMESFFHDAQRDDVLLLYYSGHGTQDVNDNLYLCARDTRSDLLVSTAISDAEINAMISMSSAQSLVIVLDCCHSGAFKGAGLPDTLRGSGRYVITSSRRSQLSADSKEVTAPSPFTRYLAEAIRSPVLPGNDEGFVPLDDIYTYVLERLRRDERQIPQRHLDSAIGDVALARRARTESVDRPEPLVVAPTRPVLGVSRASIEVRDVQPDETLPDEIIDVFNEGEGDLDWTAQADADWITVEAGMGRAIIILRPTGSGIHRSAIHIRDRGRGGAKTIPVTVQVLDRPTPPLLSLSESEVDFQTLSQNGASPRRSVQLLNKGGGELKASVMAAEPWIDVQQVGDILSLKVDTSSVGTFEGEVLVHSDGGDGRILVRAVVEAGPILWIEPPIVDFGVIKVSKSKSVDVRIGNGGTGMLEWEYGFTGDFFSIEQSEQGLHAIISDLPPGRYLGSLWVRSNGGDATLDVRAEVEPARRTTAGLYGEPSFRTMLGGPEEREQWEEERRQRLRAERERRAKARADLPKFFTLKSYWVSVAVSFAASIGLSILVWFVARWIAGASPTIIATPPISWLPLVLAGGLWAVVYSVIAAAYYMEDPERGEGIFYRRGLLGGWWLMEEDMEEGPGLVGAYPLSILIPATISVGLAYLIAGPLTILHGDVVRWFVDHYRGLALLVFVAYTSLALSGYATISFEERDSDIWSIR